MIFDITLDYAFMNMNRNKKIEILSELMLLALTLG